MGSNFTRGIPQKDWLCFATCSNYYHNEITRGACLGDVYALSGHAQEGYGSWVCVSVT